MLPRHGGATDTGRLRRLNEDSYDVRLPSAEQAAWGRLYVVADGVGGEAAGEAASKLGVETVVREYYAYPEPDPAAALRHAVEEANAAVHASAQSDRRATTLVAAAVVGETLHVANVGDSRLYLVRDGEVRQITRDHSWVQEQVRAGNLEPDAAHHHPLGNVVTRWLGQASVEPDLFALPLAEGDRVVMCSDGLIRHVADRTIGEVVEALAPEAAAARLVALANEGGGTDNITVLVVAIGESRSKPKPDTHSLPVVSPASEPTQLGDVGRARARPRPPAWLIVPLLVVVLVVAFVGLVVPRIPLNAEVAISTQDGPTALAVATDGALFVGDRAGRVQVYALGLENQTGALPDLPLLLGLKHPAPIATWAAGGQMAAMASGPDGVYAAEGDRIAVYSRTGERLRDFPAAPDGKLGQRRALAVDSEGRVYVADGARVIRLTSSGQPDTTWSVSAQVDLRSPTALALAPDGGLYVADSDDGRVVKLGPGGDLVRSWSGEGSGQLVSPRALAVTADGRLYVADVGRREVLELTATGGVGSYRRPELGEPLSLAADSAGDLYVGNGSTGRVTALRPGGWFVRLPFASL